MAGMALVSVYEFSAQGTQNEKVLLICLSAYHISKTTYKILMQFDTENPHILFKREFNSKCLKERSSHERLV
jgi:hypothetical protein